MHEFPALPQPLRWYLGTRAALLDQVLKTWVDSQRDCDFIAAPASDYGSMMAEDGFHPGPKVYELWGAEVARCLESSHASLACSLERGGYFLSSPA